MDPVRIGRGLRALRQRRRWRQEDLAAAGGVSRSAVARVEQGRGDRVPYTTLASIASALGARVIVRLDWNGEQLERLIDAGHAALTDHVVGELMALGWLCATEVTFSIYGERGSIDILAFHPQTGVLVVVEVKTTIPDLGNTLIPLDRKVRLAPRIAAERGWKVTHVGRLLVVAEGSSTRRRLAQHRAVFDGAFPIRGRAVRRWLAEPSPARGWSGLWVLSVDRLAVVTRRHRVRVTRAKRDPDAGSPPLDREAVT